MPTQSDPKSRILLDLSTSFQWGVRHAVGVVRVERELAIRFLADLDMEVIPVVWHKGALHALDRAYATDLVLVDKAPPATTLSPQHAENRDGLRPSTASHIKQVAKHRIIRFLRWGEATANTLAEHLLKICPASRREAALTRLGQLKRAARNFLRTRVLGIEGDFSGHGAENVDKHSYLSGIIHPDTNDTLLITGLSQHTYDWELLADLKQKTGMRIATVSHDFIPLKFPEYFIKGISEQFHRFSLNMMRQSDIVFCISKCTQRDLQEFCSDAQITAPPSEIIVLGTGIPCAADMAALPLPLQEKLNRGRFGLAVGTFEVRKNYAFLISLWEELLNDPTFGLDLVIVGKPGWLADKTIAQLERSPHFGHRIIWFRNMPDAGLSWLYNKCQVFLFPSFYEGWGLPIVEALQHERPAIVSNRGSAPEAGLGVATVLDTDDRAAWLKEIRRYGTPERAELARKPTLPSWEDTAATIKQGLFALQKADTKKKLG